MGWDQANNRYGVPLYPFFPPSAYYARILLDHLSTQQQRAMDWYNNYYSATFGYTLRPINALNFHVMPAKDLNLPAVYATILNDEDIYDKNNLQEQVVEIAFTYATGTDRLDTPSGSPNAQQIAIATRDALPFIASYYSRVYESIIESIGSYYGKSQLLPTWPIKLLPIGDIAANTDPTADKGIVLKQLIRKSRAINTNYLNLDTGKGIEGSFIIEARFTASEHLRAS